MHFFSKKLVVHDVWSVHIVILQEENCMTYTNERINQSSNAMSGSWAGGLEGRIQGSTLDGGDCLCASLEGESGILRRGGSPSCLPSPLTTRS